MGYLKGSDEGPAGAPPPESSFVAVLVFMGLAAAAGFGIVVVLSRIF